MSVVRVLCRWSTSCAVVVAAGLSLGVPGASAAVSCDRVASPAGSDAAAGTPASPFRSAQRLIDSLGPGQTGCLRAGSYSQPRLRFNRGGASGARLTLTSYPGERARLTGGIVEIPSGSNFVTLSRLDIDGSAAVNATVWVMSYDDIIEDSDITNRNLGTQCLILGGNGWGGASGRLLIQRNRIHNCGRYSAGNQEHAIYLENTVDTRITENLFWGSAAYVIHLYPNAQRTQVTHNVIDANRKAVVFAGNTTYTSSNNTVAYNIVTNTSLDTNIRASWGGPIGSGNSAHHNCLYNGTPGDIGTQTGFTATNNLHANPLYQDPTNHDYRLPPTSPCLPIIGYDTATKLAQTTTTSPTPTTNPTATPDTTPPTATWKTPTDGATVTGTLQETSANCELTATDNVAIDRVEFFLDGTRLNTERYAPWACNWDTTTTPNGTHTLKATAHDTAGNTTTKTITINVNNAHPTDTIAPTVAWTTPVDGDTVSGTLNETSGNCRVAASDNVAIERVEFFLDGALLNVERSAPWACRWDTTTAGHGRHTLEATAYDPAGNRASTSIEVTPR